MFWGIRPVKLYVLYFSIVISSAVAADVVFLKNGDRITGEITEIWDESLTIEPEYADKFDIDLEDIASLESDSAFEIEFGNDTQGDYFIGKSEIEGEIILTSESEELSVVLLELEHMVEIEEYFEWEVLVDTSQSLSKGTKDSFVSNLSGELELKWGDHRTLTKVSSFQEELDDEKVKDRNRYSFSYNFLFNDPWYVAVTLATESDSVASLDRRTSLVPAIGYDFYDAPGLSLSIQAGAGVQKESKAGVDSHGSLYGWHLRYKQKFFHSDLEAFHNHTVYQNLGGSENFVVATQTGLRYKFTDDIFFKIQLDYDIDSEPAEGSPKNDVILQFGAGIEF